MKGWKTIIFGSAMVVVPPALSYFGGVDWTTIGISPAASSVIGAAIIALRAVTSSPIFKS
jgi:hypothetical protein